MKPICIIPARSGSKRIKNKNIKILNGHPLIGFVINLAKKSKIFQDIVVSTDSIKIAKIAKKYGAKVPFIRCRYLSDDYTPTHLVVQNAVELMNTYQTKYHFCIYPTSVLINISDLKKAYTKIKKNNADFICAISKFLNSPQRSFKILNNKLIFKYPKYQNKRSQDLEKLYYDTGSFYIYKTSSLMKMKRGQIIPKKSTFIDLKKELIDINTMEDLKNLKKNYNIKLK